MRGAATLRWAAGQVTMEPRGAMLRDLQIQLSCGEVVAPLHTAPWVGAPEGATQTGLMQGLSGEWPCVPFGVRHSNLPTEWQAAEAWEDPYAHGYAAHHDWDLSSTADELTAQIDLPPEHPISSLNRRVSPLENGICLDLWVHPRVDCRLPIGLHPVFSLPDEVGQMHLEVEGAQSVWTHPETPAADPTKAVPGAMSKSLEMVQGNVGELLDFSHLPRDENSETRLLVCGGTGQVTLTDRKTGLRIVLQFNSDQFPFVMLWISNRGRSAAPWSSRHLALGIEPVRAAFDLGTAISAANNPLSDQWGVTAFNLVAGQPFHTRYAIKVLPPLIGAI